MDFIKKHSLPILLGTLVGTGSLIYFFRRNASKETALSFPSGVQNNKEEFNNLRAVQQKLLELSNAVPQSPNFKKEVSEVLYNYLFTRTAEIEQLKVQSIRNCYENIGDILEAIKGVITLLKQTQENMNQLGGQLDKLLQNLGLSTEQKNSISQNIANAQIEHYQKIKSEYIEQARSYLRQKTAFIGQQEGKRLLAAIESYNWSQQEQQKYHGEVLNALLDYSVQKRKGQAKVNHFCISVAVAQSQAELAEEVNEWSATMAEIYRSMNGA